PLVGDAQPLYMHAANIHFSDYSIEGLLAEFLTFPEMKWREAVWLIRFKEERLRKSQLFGHRADSVIRRGKQSSFVLGKSPLPDGQPLRQLRLGQLARITSQAQHVMIEFR